MQEHCFVSLSVWDDTKLAQETTFLDRKVFVDKTEYKCSTQRFLAPEALFQPSLADLSAVGLEMEVFQCLRECQFDKAITKNIILAGGTALLPGITKRLELELHKTYQQYPRYHDLLQPSDIKVTEVYEPRSRKYVRKKLLLCFPLLTPCCS